MGRGSALAIFRLARDFGAPGLRHGVTCRGVTVVMLVESAHYLEWISPAPLLASVNDTKSREFVRLHRRTDPPRGTEYPRRPLASLKKLPTPARRARVAWLIMRKTNPA